MRQQSLFYPKGLIVLGALNSNKIDRLSNSSNPHLVHFIYNNNVFPLKCFYNWQDTSVSSMCWSSKTPNIFYVASTKDIYEFNIKNGIFKNFNIPNLKDIHEITYYNEFIWIANTKNNNLVCFDPEDNCIKKIYDLMPFKKQICLNKHEKSNIDIVVKDEFHINQVFFDYNENLSALTHHVNGRQIKRRNGLKGWIKRQGDGGIIDIENKRVRPLQLSSPHSIRLIDNSYYVCDSATFKIKIFNKQWKFRLAISTKGYPRGMDYCSKKNLLFIGNSTIRNRYKHILKKELPFNNVEIFDLSSYKSIGSIKIENLEQINNVYLLNEYQSKHMEKYK